MSRRIVTIVFAVVAAGVTAAAQAPARQGGAPASPAPAQAARPVLPPLEPQGYTYDPDSRRDPFVSLLRSGSDTQRETLGPRPAGLPGLSTSEVALKGIITSGSGYVAVVQGADNKTYIVHVGDRLFDGTVRAINADSMVILQQVNDPLSTQKQREVRKLLRQTEEAR